MCLFGANSALPVNNALSVARKFPNFAGKVLLNQLVLGPAVVSVVFAYTMLLDGKPELIASKISKDMLPTLQTGARSETRMWASTM